MKILAVVCWDLGGSRTEKKALTETLQVIEEQLWLALSEETTYMYICVAKYS